MVENNELARAVLLFQEVISKKNEEIAHLEQINLWIADKKTATLV